MLPPPIDKLLLLINPPLRLDLNSLPDKRELSSVFGWIGCCAVAVAADAAGSVGGSAVGCI